MTKRLFVLATLLLVQGCSSAQHRRAEGFDPRVPLRVAVLPFIDRAEGDNLASKPLALFLDLLPVLSDDALTREHAATIFREKFQGNLHRTHLDVVDLHVVDSLLLHRKLDVPPMYEQDRAAAARQLGDALGADAVLFGTVTEWDRDYYLVESIVRAGLEVELRDTVTGGLLFDAQVHDVETSGISKLPVAYSPDGAIQAVLVESFKGLRNTLFITLTDDIARQIVEGLAAPAEERALGRAPEVYFVAHSAQGRLAAGDELVVVAIGTADARATFQIGDGPPVPMNESCPAPHRAARDAPAARLDHDRGSAAARDDPALGPARARASGGTFHSARSASVVAESTGISSKRPSTSAYCVP
jgi:hypothetical protein